MDNRQRKAIKEIRVLSAVITLCYNGQQNPYLSCRYSMLMLQADWYLPAHN